MSIPSGGTPILAALRRRAGGSWIGYVGDVKTPPVHPSAPDPAQSSEDPALEAVKAVFEAKAAEPAPDHLISLVSQLDAEGKNEKV